MIERMTARGLPEYDRQDEFAANGGDQLVLIPGTDPPVYRSRFEQGFVRYKWMDAGDGTEGYWTAEYPDGRIGYYGADAIMTTWIGNHDVPRFLTIAAGSDMSDPWTNPPEAPDA